MAIGRCDLGWASLYCRGGACERRRQEINRLDGARLPNNH